MSEQMVREMPMNDILNLDDYPLHALESRAGRELVASCRTALAEEGMFNLDGFVHRHFTYHLFRPLAHP